MTSTRAATLASALALLPLGACDDKGGDSASGDANLFVAGVVCTFEGSQTECQVTVENTGDGATGSFEIGVYATSTEPQIGAAPDGTARVGNIEPGDLQGALVTLSGSPSDVWVVLDWDDQVAELYEDDNAVASSPQRR